MAAKIARFNTVNSEITGGKLIWKKKYRAIMCTYRAFIWWKDCENRSSISGNIWQNTPVFLAVLYVTYTNDLVAMATSLEKSENKVTIHHLHVKRFNMVKRLWKSVQYIRRYSTKYTEPREHAMQFPFVSLFSAETTGPIFTKILHVIVTLVMLFNYAYAPHYPILFPNGIATK